MDTRCLFVTSLSVQHGTAPPLRTCDLGCIVGKRNRFVPNVQLQCKGVKTRDRIPPGLQGGGSTVDLVIKYVVSGLATRETLVTCQLQEEEQLVDRVRSPLA